MDLLKEILEPAGYEVQHLLLCPTDFGWPGRRKRLWSVSFRRATLAPKFGMNAAQFDKLFFSSVACTGEVFLNASDAERQRQLRQAAESRRLPATQPDGGAWRHEYILGPGRISRLAGYRRLLESSPSKVSASALIVANLKQNPDVIRAVSHEVFPTLLREADLWILKSDRLGVTPEMWPAPLVPEDYMLVMGWPLQADESSLANAFGKLPGKVLKSLAGNGMNIKVAGAVIFYALSCSTRVASA